MKKFLSLVTLLLSSIIAIPSFANDTKTEQNKLAKPTYADLVFVTTRKFHVNLFKPFLEGDKSLWYLQSKLPVLYSTTNRLDLGGGFRKLVGGEKFLLGLKGFLLNKQTVGDESVYEHFSWGAELKHNSFEISFNQYCQKPTCGKGENGKYTHDLTLEVQPYDKFNIGVTTSNFVYSSKAVFGELSFKNAIFGAKYILPYRDKKSSTLFFYVRFRATTGQLMEFIGLPWLNASTKQNPEKSEIKVWNKRYDGAVTYSMF